MALRKLMPVQGVTFWLSVTVTARRLMGGAPRAPAAATRSRWLTLGVTKKRGLPRFVSAKYSLVRLRIYYTIRKYAIASFTELFFRNLTKKFKSHKFFSFQKAFLPRATRVIYFLFLVLFLYLCLFLSLYLLLS